MWEVAPASVHDPDAVGLLRGYYVEVADRYRLLYLGRRSTAAEIEKGLAADSVEDLVPPRGLFLVGRCAGVPAGCVGLRLFGDGVIEDGVIEDGVIELARVFVRTRWRGTGGGAELLAAAEEAAAGLGGTRIVLDTRSDLVEARALYRRNGYSEIAPYNRNKHAEIWFGKELA